MIKLHTSAETPGLVNRQKLKFIYRLLIAVIPVAVTTIPFVMPIHSAGDIIQERVQQFFFFFTGGSFCFYLYTKKIYWFGTSPGYGAGPVCCAALISSCISFFLFNVGMLLSFANASAFCLPWFAIQSWRFYKKIPFTRFTNWSSPLHDAPGDEILLVNITRICFYNETKEPLSDSVFVEAPVDCKLGKAFFSLVEKNAVPVNTDACSWEFYHPSLWGLVNKRMDPELSIRDNGLGNYAGILVRQIKSGEKNN